MNHKLQLVSATLAGVLVTVAAAGIASASMDHGQNGDLGRFARADADGNGTITRAEWIAAANARFDKLDVNKDGKLTPDELPHHGRHHGGCGSGGGDEPPPGNAS
ncbi:MULTISPECIES: hypothetical protein [unclassified Sphingomonas]|jgi:EF hand|uniref:hypothetical protein n=1 Tax=unclassified Sphingomonas TaxID=196159 RepID=UPI000A7E2DD6|nr:MULTISPECIES: hypothetical protein [unclassified Sphingomonas]